MTLLSYQPFKALYVLSALAFELLRFPLWFFKYAFAFGRQHRFLSFRQALGLRILSSVVLHSAAVRVKAPLPLTPGKEKERFVVLNPAPEGKYKGPLESNPDVKPVAIGGTWYPAPLTAASPKENVLVVLHIHGGAYVIGDGRTENSGYFAGKLLKKAGATHVLMPQYRLSQLPASKTSNPFPAAIQDSLTGYLYLVNELHVPANQIVLSGDSAGANAAISLLRYFEEYGKELGIPKPLAAWLWSPWVEIQNAVTDEFTRTNRNYGTDYLPFNFTYWGALAYAGLGGLKVLDQPYISSLKYPFKTEVPLWVTTGGREVLFFEDSDWAQAMRSVGNKVELDVEEHAPHDILLIGNVVGFDKEANGCAERAGLWLKEVRK